MSDKYRCSHCGFIGWETWTIPNTHPSGEDIPACYQCGEIQITRLCTYAGCVKAISQGRPNVVCTDGVERYVLSCYSHGGIVPFELDSPEG